VDLRMTSPFDEHTRRFQHQRNHLELRKNAVFAAACAERLMPLYQQFRAEQSWDGANSLAAILGHQTKHQQFKQVDRQ
jgi:hypothetical protein